MTEGNTPAEYRPARMWGHLAVYLFGAFILASAGAAWGLWSEIGLLAHIQGGGIITEAEANAIESGLGLAGEVYASAFALSAAVFLFWLYRVYANLPALGVEDLRRTPDGAVGWWFAPVFNLFRPYQLVREVWKASDPATADNSLTWKNAAVPLFLPLWWAAWLGFGFLFSVGALLARNAGTSVEKALTADEVLLAMVLFGLAAAALAIPVIRGVNRRQEARHGVQNG